MTIIQDSTGEEGRIIILQLTAAVWGVEETAVKLALLAQRFMETGEVDWEDALPISLTQTQ